MPEPATDENDRGTKLLRDEVEVVAADARSSASPVRLRTFPDKGESATAAMCCAESQVRFL
jgi:hypothetical protein